MGDQTHNSCLSTPMNWTPMNSSLHSHTVNTLNLKNTQNFSETLLLFHLPFTSKTTATDLAILLKLFSRKVIMHSSLPIQWTLSSLCWVWCHWSFLPGNSVSFASGVLHYHSGPPTAATIPSLSPSDDLFHLLFKMPSQHSHWVNPSTLSWIVHLFSLFYIYTLKL